MRDPDFTLPLWSLAIVLLAASGCARHGSDESPVTLGRGDVVSDGPLSERGGTRRQEMRARSGSDARVQPGETYRIWERGLAEERRGELALAAESFEVVSANVEHGGTQWLLLRGKVTSLLRRDGRLDRALGCGVTALAVAEARGVKGSRDYFYVKAIVADVLVDMRSFAWAEEMLGEIAEAGELAEDDSLRVDARRKLVASRGMRSVELRSID